jgi:hypothetical protein
MSLLEASLLLVLLIAVSGAYAIAVVLLARWVGRKRPSPPTRDDDEQDPISVDRLRCGDLVIFAGRRFRLYSDDLAAARFLNQLSIALLAAGKGETARILLGSRTSLRRMVREQSVAGLTWGLTNCSANLRRLIVWTLGRCGNSRVIPVVSSYRTSNDRRLRLEVARSLHRLAARAELTAIADSDADPWIRGYARAHSERRFDALLKHFTTSDVHAGRPIGDKWRSPMPWLLTVPLGRPHRGKPAGLIRRLLEHIRHLVRGTA